MAVHAGWRGTALGIAGSSFREFSAAVLARQGKAVRFLAAIGPCIQFESFEVGAEVIAAFPGAESGGLARYLRTEEGNRKYLFNLPGENLRQLKAAAEGLSLEVDGLDLCTVKGKGLLPSYRREREKAGRILSFLEFSNTVLPSG
jgi:copper oxidase (laccase) domain-containing protein